MIGAVHQCLCPRIVGASPRGRGGSYCLEATREKNNYNNKTLNQNQGNHLPGPMRSEAGCRNALPKVCSHWVSKIFLLLLLGG